MDELNGASINSTPVRYAGFWVRYCAIFVDSILVGVLSYVIRLIFAYFLGKNASPISLFISIILSWGYYIYMTNKYGATYGKKMAGIEVRADDNSRLPLSRIIIRETIGKLISGVILFIGYIMAAFTVRKQTLHDKIARSIVIYKDPAKKHSVAFIIVMIIVSLLVLSLIVGIVFYFFLASINRAHEIGNTSLGQNSLTASSTAQSDTQDVLFIAPILTKAAEYYNTKRTFSGFQASSTSLAQCSNDPIVNISSDGQEIAVFERLCAEPGVYVCTGLDGHTTKILPLTRVSENFALSNHSTCQ